MPSYIAVIISVLVTVVDIAVYIKIGLSSAFSFVFLW